MAHPAPHSGAGLRPQDHLGFRAGDDGRRQRAHRALARQGRHHHRRRRRSIAADARRAGTNDLLRRLRPRRGRAPRRDGRLFQHHRQDRSARPDRLAAVGAAAVAFARPLDLAVFRARDRRDHRHAAPAPERQVRRCRQRYPHPSPRRARSGNRPAHDRGRGALQHPHLHRRGPRDDGEHHHLVAVPVVAIAGMARARRSRKRSASSAARSPASPTGWSRPAPSSTRRSGFIRRSPRSAAWRWGRTSSAAKRSSAARWW